MTNNQCINCIFYTTTLCNCCEVCKDKEDFLSVLRFIFIVILILLIIICIYFFIKYK